MGARLKAPKFMERIEDDKTNGIRIYTGESKELDQYQFGDGNGKNFSTNSVTW